MKEIRLLLCIAFSVLTACSNRSNANAKVTCVFPVGYTGVVMIAERRDYLRPPSVASRYILSFSNAGYIQIRKPSIEKLLCDKPLSEFLAARYADGTAIPIDPDTGFGLRGFCGQTGHNNDWYTFLFLGTKADADAFYAPPHGNPLYCDRLRLEWLKQHKL